MARSEHRSSTEFTKDELHILLDGLNELRRHVRYGHQPWNDYVGDDDDPKLASDSYQAVIESADEKATRILGAKP